MQKRIGLTFLLMCLLLMMPFVSVSYAMQMTTTLYATGADGCDPRNVMLFNQTAGIAADKHYNWTAYEKGCNPSWYFHEIQFQDLAYGDVITAISSSTWTVTYYGCANDSDIGKFCIWWGILNDTEHDYWYDVEEEPSIEFWELAGICPIYNSTHCEAIATTFKDVINGTHIGTTNVPRIEVDPTDWLIVEWGTNNTDGTDITDELFFDTLNLPTKITGFSYEARTSAYWNPAVLTIWQILLPLIFVIGAAVPFVSYGKGKMSLHDAIILSVALLFLAVMVPVAMNMLYSA